MSGTGRSGSGRLRNFKAMNDGKLQAVYWTVVGEADDSEATDALRAEMLARGLDAGVDALDGEEIYDEEELT